MLVIGLTGGIGTGKSTVAALFAKLNVPIIDADLIAREVTAQGQPALNAIAHHFKHTILLPDGNLDRKALKKIIFEQPAERRWLENLLHPLIREAIKKQLMALIAPYCIVVIPLLLEGEPDAFITRILVIDAPEAAQIERVAERDKLSKAQIEKILQSQLQREKRLAGAQDVIVNDGKLTELQQQVEKLHEKYMRLATQ